MPSTRLQGSLNITLIGLSVNALLAVGKFVTGWLGHSQALVADAVESGVDVISGLVVWQAVQVADTPPDQEHPYGHGKAEPLAASIVAGFLFLAAMGIGFHAVRGFFISRPVPETFTLWVLILVVVVKEVLFRITSQKSAKLNNSAVLADAWHHRSDAITSLAAAIGISLAIWGGPRFIIADNVAALVAALIICFNGWKILRQNMNELMDVAADPSIIQQIMKTASHIDKVKRVEKCIVRKAGHRHLVDMHIEVDPAMTVRDAHKVAHQVKDEVLRKFETVVDVLVHVEPAD